MTNKLEWNEKYSVGIEEIDNQHKKMFSVINELLDSIRNNDTEEHLGNIIKSLIDYKIFHFETEEKYFKKFNYDGASHHIAKHQEFSSKLEEIKSKHSGFTIDFAFELVDFLEDWLIKHLMVEDQKYVECFHSNGLK
jgi:hemerythrin-like metal-binding protein